MPSKLTNILLNFLFASTVTVDVQSIVISLPLSPSSDTVLLDPSLISFSIEQDRWTDWAGISSPNVFLVNALDNLAQRTGQPPYIRIGADSEDHTDFSPQVEFSEAIFPAPSESVPYPEASNVTVGSRYYELASHLPRDTHVIWGVNFGTNNLTAAFLEAHAIKNAFASPTVRSAGIILEQIEIGNEADLYGGNGHRNSATWTIEEYVKEWVNFAEDVTVAAGISSSGPKYMGLSFSGSSHSTSSFSPQGAFANGIIDSVPGKLISSISQHKYSGSGVANIANLPSLMSKATIRSNLSTFIPDIAVVHDQGLDYVFGETNSYFSHGAPGVSNAAGSAIWALDYTLFGATIGIKRFHFHEGVGYRYNMIQPVTLTRSIIDGTTLSEPLPPHIQPAYYGALVAAEAIGKTGASSIVELQINDTTLAGFAIFEEKALKRAVLIDSTAFLSTSSGERTSRNVTIVFNGSNPPPTFVDIKRLAINFADDTAGLKWGGQTFETSDSRPQGSLQVVTAGVNLDISIRATEAILLTFH